MKAVILAGGEGKRLLPHTTTFPKPTMPVGNRPILELILRQLSAHGIKEIVIPTGYLEELIRGDLRERFLFMNGDILTDIDFRQLVEDHCAGGHDLTIVLSRRCQPTALKSTGLKIRGLVHGGYWLDIGRSDDHEQACRDSERLRLW